MPPPCTPDRSTRAVDCVWERWRPWRNRTRGAAQLRDGPRSAEHSDGGERDGVGPCAGLDGNKPRELHLDLHRLAR